MTDIVIANQLEASHLRNAIQEYVRRLGTDRVPTRMVQLISDLDAIARHMSPHPATSLAKHHQPADSDLLSYNQAANRLGVSTRTVSRMVSNNQLDAVGRRIKATSIEHLTN